jgi:hypothetical protein
VLNGISLYEAGAFVRTSCELKTLDYFIDSVEQVKQLLARERLGKTIAHWKAAIANTLIYERDYESLLRGLFTSCREPVDIAGLYLLDSIEKPLPDGSADSSRLQSSKALAVLGSLIEKHEATGSNVFVLTRDESAALAEDENWNEQLAAQGSSAGVASFGKDGHTAACVLAARPSDEGKHVGLVLNISGFEAYQNMWLEALEMIAGLLAYGLLSLHKAEDKERLLVQLQSAMAEIRTLRGIVPICSHCKGIRDDAGYWRQLEEYMEEHSEVRFSHGICDKCAKEYYSTYTQ